MRQVRIIAILNQKGGVGKTTLSTNIVHGLARKGYKVLAIDLDPQAQLTTSLGFDRSEVEGLEAALLGDSELSDVTYNVRDKLDLVPAGYDLTELENLSEGGSSRGLLLKKSLLAFSDNYDFVIIDCPPSSGLLVVNAIFATQEVLIPMTGDFLALQGLAHLMGTLKNFESVLDRQLKRWIVMSRFVARRRLAQDVKEKLIEHFPNSVLATDISESVVLAECPSFGKSIFEYKPGSRSAKEYDSLTDDLIIGRVC